MAAQPSSGCDLGLGSRSHASVPMHRSSWRLRMRFIGCRTGRAAQKKGRFPSQGKRPTRSAERGSKALETCVCGWTTVLRETRIGSCDWVTMRTAADCATGTKNDPGVCAGRPPLPATDELWRCRLKLLPIDTANGRRGCTDRHARRCRRGHGGTCSRARRRPLVAHCAGDGR